MERLCVEAGQVKKAFFYVVIASVVLAFGCRTPSGGTGGAESGRIQHVVLFWLKEPGNPQAREKIVRASREFASIPGVLDVRVGTVLSSDRPIVDDSFDVALVVSCKTEQALADYLAHPKHTQAVEQIVKPLVGKILVYDFVEK